MFKDRKLVWVIEYSLGIILLVAVIPFIVHPQAGWSAAHGWAYLLFIACSGITLVGSASAMRQRIEMANRIRKLEQMVEVLKKQAQSECVQKNRAIENRQVGVGSAN